METITNATRPPLTPDSLRERYAAQISQIALALGSNCVLITPEGTVCYRVDPIGTVNSTPLQPVCPFFKEACDKVILGRSADIITCAAGYLFAVAPLYASHGVEGVVLLGPLSLSDTLKCPRPESGICSPVRRTTRARADAVTHLLNIVSGDISDRDATERLSSEKRFGARMEIMAGMNALRRSGKSTDYPVKMEDTLTQAIVAGDVEKAKSTLNRILSYVFYAKSTAESSNLVLVRLIELLTVISRAAVEAGADALYCLEINAQSISEAIRQFDRETRIEDIAVWLSGVLEEYTAVLTDLGSTRHADMLSTVKNYILTNYMHKLTLEELAEQVFISPAYLSKIFKKEVGMPFVQYLNQIRVEQSKYLLLFTDKPITEIYSLTGFEDQSYFTKVFKSFVGLSPGKFRESAGRLSQSSGFIKYNK